MNIVALQDKPLFQNATEIIIFDGLRIFPLLRDRVNEPCTFDFQWFFEKPERELLYELYILYQVILQYNIKRATRTLILGFFYK